MSFQGEFLPRARGMSERLHAVIEGPGRCYDGASCFCVDGHWEQAVAHAVEWLREDMDLLGTDEKVNITVSLRMKPAKSCCLCHPEEQDREPPPDAKQMAERIHDRITIFMQADETRTRESVIDVIERELAPLVEENARLKKGCRDRKEWRSRMGLNTDSHCSQLVEEIAALEAEVKRLREALQRAIQELDNHGIGAPESERRLAGLPPEPEQEPKA